IFQDNHIVFANKAVADQTSRTLDKLLSLENLLELVHSDDRTFVAQNLQSQMRDEPTSRRYDFRLMEKAGQIRWIEIFASRIMYRGQAAIQAFTIDVTERRQSEEIARQFQEKLKALHELSIVLTKANSLDELCCLAIVSGCNYLGFDRLGLWTLDEETG